MITLNLTFVKRTERTSTRTNKPYTSLSIKAQEYGDNFLSGFGNKDNASWKEGDVVEVAEVKQVEKDGKTYYNFEMPKTSKADNAVVIDLLNEMNNKLVSLSFEIAKVTSYIDEKRNPKKSYPEMTEENNASGLSDDPREAESLEEAYNRM